MAGGCFHAASVYIAERFDVKITRRCFRVWRGGYVKPNYRCHLSEVRDLCSVRISFWQSYYIFLQKPCFSFELRHHMLLHHPYFLPLLSQIVALFTSKGKMVNTQPRTYLPLVCYSWKNTAYESRDKLVHTFTQLC